MKPLFPSLAFFVPQEAVENSSSVNSLMAPVSEWAFLRDYFVF